MAYKTPTRRKLKRSKEQLNLIPILDSVFIFLFFLLMSTQFLKTFEIGSDIPILSAAEPPKSKEKPLGLTVEIRKNSIDVSTSKGPIRSKRIPKINGEYDLNTLHDVLVQIKKRYAKEKQVILEPRVDIEYQQVINIMDAIRMMRKTDDTITVNDSVNGDVPVKELFNKIIFGNLMS